MEDMIIRNQDYFYKIAYTYLRNSEDAKDAVSNTFEKGLLKRHQLKDADKLKTWYISILINECRELLRKRKLKDRKTKLFIFKDKRSYIEESLDLKMAISRLTPLSRDVITLRYLLEYTQEEVATILNIPIGTVKSTSSRGLKELKTILGGAEYAK